MVDVVTVIATAICTGMGVSIGNILFEIFFKDYFKAWKKQHKRHVQEIKKNLRYKRPWLAAILNFFFWGIGYLYLKKKTGMGVLLLFVWFFLGAGFWINEVQAKNAFEGFSYFFLVIIISGYLAYDGYMTAKERNAEKQ